MPERTETLPITMSAPDIDDSDIQAVVSVLRSGRLALGPRIEEFERLIAETAGTNHAVAVSSGTAALHLIIRALGIGPGDEVIVPSFTFAASVNAILYEGATPVFADIEPEYLALASADAERQITARTRAILAVDIFGHPADWHALGTVAERAGIAMIDDACEALGSRYFGSPIGSFGNAAAFAFYPNKQITTGEGGMLVTDDGALARTARSLRNHGRDTMGTALNHQRLGFNYRMDEMSAALGSSQLKRLGNLRSRRERVAALYDARLTGLDEVTAPRVHPRVEMSWFAYVVRLAESIDRASVIDSMESAGVPVRCYFSPIHLQPYMIDRLGPRPSLRTTERIAARTLALPFHGGMTESQIDRVVTSLVAAIHRAGNPRP